MIVRVTGTYDLKSDPLWKQLVLQEVRLECDTSLAPVTINLFQIAELNTFYNVKVYVSDVSGMASAHPITINAFSGDTIDASGQTQVVINQNGVSAAFAVVYETQWVCFESNATPSVPSTNNFGLFAQTAQSTPITTIGQQTLIGTGVGTLSVPANGFNVGDSFSLRMGGEMSCANNDDIRFRITSGAVILADSGSVNLPQLTNKIWRVELDFTVRTIGGAGGAAIVTNGSFVYTKNASLAFEGVGFNTINNTTFNTTILNTLNITAEWVGFTAGDAIHTDYLVLNKIY